jgi:hypothetical protein
MSVKSTRRFDKYIPLFGKDNDDRVTLLLGELEDNVKDGLKFAQVANPNIKNYITSDAVLKADNRGLWHINFTTPKPAPTTDKDVHDEWKTFMAQLGIRLAKVKISSTVPSDTAKLKLVQNLENTPASGDQLVLCILENIATFTNDSSTGGRSFINNHSELKKAKSVEFKTVVIDIIDGLSSTTILSNTDALLDYIKNMFGLTSDKPSTSASAATVTSNAKNLLGAGADKAEWKALFSDPLWSSPNDQDTVNREYLLAIKTFVFRRDNVNSFNYNFDKYLKNKLFDAQQGILSVPTASSFFDDPIVDQGKYWRKADGSLWTMDVNGKEEQVDIHSQKFKSLKTTDKCLGTNVKDLSSSGGKTCGDYLRDCLSGNDVQKCVEFLKNDKYWNVVDKEVDEMLPAIALKTLESFEFKTVDTYDETNKMNIRKVISVTEWLANLLKMVKPSSPLDEKAYKDIAGNEKLKGYLALLVKKINSNPAILNRGIVKSDEQQRYNPNAFSGSKLATMGLKPRLAVSVLAPSSIERLANTVRSEQDAIRIRLMGPAIFGGILTGGSGAIDELEYKLKDETKQTWSIFSSHYLALVSQLKGMGKDIAEEDKKKITELLNNLKNSEVKLMQVILMTEKYKDLISIHGEKDNSNTLKIDHLKQFVDQRNKYFMRVTKKQNDLISIIKSISEAVQKEAPTKTEPLAEPTQEKLALAGLLG